MKEVTIMRGIPGSGKSTFVRNQIKNKSNQHISSAFCSADKFFIENGIYRFIPNLLASAHEYCFRDFISMINLNIDAIYVDNTNLTPVECSPYVLSGRSFGYDIVFCDFKSVTVAQCIERDTKNIPEATMYNMMATFCNYSPMKRVVPYWNGNGFEYIEV